MKTFEIEMSATTYRTFTIKAESLEDAEELAFYALDNDEEVNSAWKDNAKIESSELCQ